MAGSTRLKAGAPATSTPLRYPWGTAQDGSGNLYIADMLDNRILMVDPSGNIHIVAGKGTEGFSGDGGPALQAEFDEPRGLALDGKGGLYVVDWNNSRVRLINLTNGSINTVAGNGEYMQPAGDAGPATQAAVSVTDIAVDSAGNLYIADYDNSQIRKVSAADQTISTLAGQSFSGMAGDGGPASKSVLDGPSGLSISPQGVLYFADSNNNYVRQIVLQTGVISAFAGSGNIGLVSGRPAATAPLAFPFGTAVESTGNVLLLEDNYIQRVTVSTGTLTTVAGSATLGDSGDGGAAISATFALPFYISGAPNGDILVSDTGNFRVRRIRGVAIDTVAGTTIQNKIPATTAYLNQPGSVVANGQGGFTIADTGDSEVRTVSGGTINKVAGTGVAGITAGELNFPIGVGLDGTGSILVADSANNRVLRLVTGGTYTVVAGNGAPGYLGDHGYAPAAYLNLPTGAVGDQAGNIYIADSANCAIRMVNPSLTITTLAGGTVCASTGDNGPASNAEQRGAGQSWEPVFRRVFDQQSAQDQPEHHDHHAGGGCGIVRLYGGWRAGDNSPALGSNGRGGGRARERLYRGFGQCGGQDDHRKHDLDRGRNGELCIRPGIRTRTGRVDRAGGFVRGHGWEHLHRR